MFTKLSIDLVSNYKRQYSVSLCYVSKATIELWGQLLYFMLLTALNVGVDVVLIKYPSLVLFTSLQILGKLVNLDEL